MKRERKLVYTTAFHESTLNAIDYYENAQRDLGDYFLASLKDCLNSLKRNPEIYKVFFQSYRQAPVKKFPYVVVYRIKPEEIVVENVFNTYQNPLKKIR